ncbi:hypothetical protein L2E82_45441 [Cichorium intybus]|uniref:Uncharacterized protein n=1 Tax=Cichorium intybus TaxID=13427 RepID=A0ACB8ZUC1_CICIN|nr:hypothetical protein L2E82_45441 [Cichorium intybus]
MKRSGAGQRKSPSPSLQWRLRDWKVKVYYVNGRFSIARRKGERKKQTDLVRAIRGVAREEEDKVMVVERDSYREKKAWHGGREGEEDICVTDVDNLHYSGGSGTGKLKCIT